MKRSYKIVQDKNVVTALGRAVSYLMGKPSFAEMKFGHWSQTLCGQINRGHYFFVVETEQVVGFLGWAFVDEPIAEAWVKGERGIGGDESKNGNCMIVNAWSADDIETNRIVLTQIRKAAVGKKCVYAKRFYKDGRMRPVRIAINKFVQSHTSSESIRV